MPLSKLLLTRKIILTNKTSGAIISSFGPMQYNLVALVTSRFTRKFRTNGLVISEMPKKLLLGTFESTYSVICLKSECSTGSLSCDATFTKYLVKTFDISFSWETKRSFSFSPI